MENDITKNSTELEKTLINFIKSNQRGAARYRNIIHGVIISFIGLVLAMGFYARILIITLRDSPGSKEAIAARMRILTSNDSIMQENQKQMLRKEDSILLKLSLKNKLWQTRNQKHTK